jgi:hypothetical protein
MKNIFYAIAQTGLYKSPGTGRLLDILPGAWVELQLSDAGDPMQVTIPFGGLQSTLWTQIAYNGNIGWVYDPKLEELIYLYGQDVVGIFHPTPNRYDLKQYLVLDDGRTLYNGCGEFCVAYITGTSIDEFFNNWKAKSPAWYQRIVPANRTTGIVDLDDMLKTYGHRVPSLRWDAALYDPIVKRALVSPGRMRTLLETKQLIAGVKIDHSGRLNGSGVGHWVVVEEIQPNGIQGGFVRLYNSAPNAIELYSWSEFTKSSPEVYGIWVERGKP